VEEGSGSGGSEQAAATASSMIEGRRGGGLLLAQVTRDPCPEAPPRMAAAACSHAVVRASAALPRAASTSCACSRRASQVRLSRARGCCLGRCRRRGPLQRQLRPS